MAPIRLPVAGSRQVVTSVESRAASYRSAMRWADSREGGMDGHVADALAVEEDGAPVAEAGQIVGAPAHGGTLAQPSGGAQAG